jgi:hypothetical protein
MFEEFGLNAFLINYPVIAQNPDHSPNVIKGEKMAKGNRISEMNRGLSRRLSERTWIRNQSPRGCYACGKGAQKGFEGMAKGLAKLASLQRKENMLFTVEATVGFMNVEKGWGVVCKSKTNVLMM